MCNAEKIEILKVKKSESLNKRNELQTGCIHYLNKFCLKSTIYYYVIANFV